MTARARAGAAAAACALALAGACHGGGGAAADAGADAPPARPVCAAAAGMFVLPLDGIRQPVVDDAPLGIVLGFQGFLFARLGATTADELPALTTVESTVKVEGKLDLTTNNGGVTCRRRGDGWETDPVNVILNDVSLAELLGDDATFTLRVTGTTCTAVARARVRLVPGGFQGPDGGQDGDGGGDGGGDAAPASDGP